MNWDEYHVQFESEVEDSGGETNRNTMLMASTQTATIEATTKPIIHSTSSLRVPSLPSVLLYGCLRVKLWRRCCWCSSLYLLLSFSQASFLLLVLLLLRSSSSPFFFFFFFVLVLSFFSLLRLLPTSSLLACIHDALYTHCCCWCSYSSLLLYYVVDIRFFFCLGIKISMISPTIYMLIVESISIVYSTVYECKYFNTNFHVGGFCL